MADVLELALGDYAGIRQEYRTRFYAEVLDYLANKANLTAKRNAVLKAVTDAFNSAGDLGYTDGGGDLSQPDQDFNTWLGGRMEMEYANVRAMFEQLRELRKDEEFAVNDAYEIADARADGYTRTLDSIYNEAKLRGAKKGLMLTFGGQDGHTKGFPCPECRKLKNQRHRTTWWIRRGLIPYPGNMNFSCGCWQCKHFLFTDDGRIFTL